MIVFDTSIYIDALVTATLIAPYSTDGPITIEDGGTRFDTALAGMYIVTIAGMSHQVSVAKDDVLTGNMIAVP